MSDDEGAESPAMDEGAGRVESGGPARWPGSMATGPTSMGHFVTGEGLRARKKRMMRQQISDTATQMFLDRGFDEVRVAEVAAACGVSEKTVFNYFPTKESLLLDREDEMARQIREALGRHDVSPIAAAVELLVAEMQHIYRQLIERDLDLAILGRFRALIQDTPSLRAAQLDMMERLVQVAAEAMADRAGVDPLDPEPQIAAASVLGLWRIQFHGLQRHADADGSPDPAVVRDAVIADIRRAARLIDTGLWSFSVAVQGTRGRQQLKDAADAANEARKQVIAAIRQARAAWRELVAEGHDRHRSPDDEHADRADDRRRQMQARQQQWVDQRRARQQQRTRRGGPHGRG